MEEFFKGLKKWQKLALIVVLIVVGIFAIFWMNTQTISTQLNITPEIQKCAEEKMAKLHGTVPGQISIRFKNDINESKARELVKSYGLNVFYSSHVRLDNSYFLYVNVERGEEFEWMCEFERNDMVNYVTNVIQGGAGPAPYQ